MVIGILVTGKGCGSSADLVMGRVIEMVLRTADGVIEYGQRDEAYRQRCNMDRVIGMKGTSKGCGSCGDGVTGCCQRDKVYWQTMWLL